MRPRQRVVASHQAMGKPKMRSRVAVQSDSFALRAMAFQSMSFECQAVAGQDGPGFWRNEEKVAEALGGRAILRASNDHAALGKRGRNFEILAFVAHRRGAREGEANDARVRPAGLHELR